jgi:hypothetical protein
MLTLMIIIFLLMFLENMKLNTYTPKADFNGMDCTDLVIGSARGSASRIWDYYTRDRYAIFFIIMSWHLCKEIIFLYYIIT